MESDIIGIKKLIKVRYMSILVSVYCLAYNHGKYIRSALEGFVNQKTNFEYEVFVHDDASTDETAAIILEYAKKYPQIIKPIIQKENQYSKGVSMLYTYILPNMSGKYIHACEGDDYWCDPNKLQQQVDFLEKHSEYMACVHSNYIENQRSGERFLNSRRKKNGNVKMKEIIEWNNVFHTSSILYRRWAIENKPKYMKSINGVGDWFFALWLRMNGKIYYIATPMSVYRFGTEGSWTERNNNLDKNIKDKEYILNLFNQESNFKYNFYVEKKINRMHIENLYMKGDIQNLKRMGYKKIICAGYFGIAVSVFLQLHNYKLYSIISRKFYGKGEEN